MALSIEAGDTPDGARALSIRGEASVEIVDGVVEEYLAAARKSMDAEAAAQFGAAIAARCTRRWHESRSRRAGCVTDDSARVECRGSCRKPAAQMET